jgi:hypothetical protein
MNKVQGKGGVGLLLVSISVKADIASQKRLIPYIPQNRIHLDRSSGVRDNSATTSKYDPRWRCIMISDQVDQVKGKK